MTVGTIFHGSRIPLNKWLAAIYLMCSSKKGVSAHQLHRELGITYKSAWHMCHRIREAMAQSPLAEKIASIIEVDETYVGGKPRKGDKKPRKRGRGTSKTPVVATVEREGKIRAKKMKKLSAKNLRAFISEHASKDATIMTDGYSGYRGLHLYFAGHEVVDHAEGEFARGDAHVNNAESWFSLLKRGIMGAFHHVSEKHLDRYCNEFVFRWDNRHVNDFERTTVAIEQVLGKRLMYADLISE